MKFRSSLSLLKEHKHAWGRCHQWLKWLCVPIFALTVLTLIVACGDKGNNHGATEFTTTGANLSEDEKFERTLRGTFGDSYNRASEENLRLAARIEGASATVERLADDSAGNVMHGVHVKFLLKDEPGEISAQKALYNKVVEPLTNDPGVDPKYSISARCLGNTCLGLIAILTERTRVAASGAAASNAAGDSAVTETGTTTTTGAGEVRELVSQTVIIFQRVKKNTSPATGGQTGKDKNASNSNDMEIAVGETQPMVVVWSASADPKRFNGGTKPSTEEIQRRRHGQSVPDPSPGNQTTPPIDQQQQQKEEEEKRKKAETEAAEAEANDRASGADVSATAEPEAEVKKGNEDPSNQPSRDKANTIGTGNPSDENRDEGKGKDTDA